MTSSRKVSSSFHKVKYFDLPKVQIEDEYTNIKFIDSGWYARIYSATNSHSSSSVVLKCIGKVMSKRKDFFREFHYNYFLSPHPNIVNSYEVAFETNDFYVFAQELAPEGDLSRFVTKGGLGEIKCKKVAEQITFALEFMHSKSLVHRDVRLENIFVYDKDMKRVKLGDFGLTEKAATLVKKTIVQVRWAPPEVCQAVFMEGYHAETSSDVWQLGILLFVCLTGTVPWSYADIRDQNYNEWVAWHKRKTTKIPRRFKCFTPRFLRLMRRLLEPKPEKRAEVREVYKYLNDPWLNKNIDPLDILNEENSTEIFVSNTKNYHHGEIEHKAELVEKLKSYGVQTTIDKSETTRRICEWLISSVPTQHRGM